jgi:hypothetical protein
MDSRLTGWHKRGLWKWSPRCCSTGRNFTPDSGERKWRRVYQLLWMETSRHIAHGHGVT